MNKIIDNYSKEVYEKTGSSKLFDVFSSALDAGIRILAPHVNQLYYDKAEPSGDSIRAPFARVNGLKPDALDEIRKKRGWGYGSINEFIAVNNGLSIDDIQLIYDCGALDNLIEEKPFSEILGKKWEKISKSAKWEDSRSRELMLTGAPLRIPDTSAGKRGQKSISSIKNGKLDEGLIYAEILDVCQNKLKLLDETGLITAEIVEKGPKKCSQKMAIFSKKFFWVKIVYQGGKSVYTVDPKNKW